MSAPSVVEEVFLAALAKGTPAERVAYLDGACKDDADLRRRVERLLAAHPQAEQFLEAGTVPPRDGTAAYAPPGEQTGAVIAGRFKLVEKIGEGGMGTVWVAQQTEPVKRVVAVKLIKAGMDSSAVLARFEAERQALALMDHPNIARVLDGGTTQGEPGGVSAGRPYFVMELVKGVPITQFCDARKLTPRQRLELFVPVCHAIQHAHQKGVIHRDIKPSNVLVALYDDRPVPKVIDFGVAKAAGQTLTDKSLMTGFGAVVGTPEYMSPEQASLNNLDIDTRSDVYSLGVLLYELLAGSPPFRGEELKRAGLVEMLRIVCEQEPPRPSVKLSTAGKRASISADRGTEPKKLTGLLRNELDWIVMKALEKDRARRYETVNGFAADVQRYLAGEAVQAHPPSAAYRLRKFVRKHRVGLATSVSFLGLLMVASVVSIGLAVKARRAEALAEQRREESDANAQEAKKNSDLYQMEADENLCALVEAEITSKSLQIDLDLSEVRTDPRVGLLRLARPLKQVLESHGRKRIRTITVGIPTDPTTGQPLGDLPDLDNPHGDRKALREFTTLAALAAGQQFAPLLPPITHDGRPIGFASLSPDNQTLLTLGEDQTARLWETRTFRPIAVLRQGNERVMSCGFSPDGKTIFTDDRTSVARFWDVPTGRYRAATEARKNRYEPLENSGASGVVTSRNAVSQIGAGRLLTRSSVAKGPETVGDLPRLVWEGPVELWDTATGRLVGRLEVPDGGVGPFDSFQFLGERWITNLREDKVAVFSAEDGRLLARLEHPADEHWFRGFADVSPSGHAIATVSYRQGEKGDGAVVIRVWDAGTWKAQTVNTLPGGWGYVRIRYWMDDAPGGGSVIGLGWEGGWLVFRAGRDELVAELGGGSPDLLSRVGDLAHSGDGQVYDIRTWQRLLPPPGRRFHPDLARFSPDGRFVSGESVVIDTRTDKQFPIGGQWHRMPGFGLIANLSNRTFDGPVDNRTVQFLPPADRLNIPPDLLELWAQVAVRGHLDEHGAFVPWNEETWEKKRQELAAKPAPVPDFPFPGYVATDKLHWLRQEYENAKDAAKPALAARLLAAAEAAGDKAEAVRWRAFVHPEVPATKPAPPK